MPFWPLALCLWKDSSSSRCQQDRISLKSETRRRQVLLNSSVLFFRVKVIGTSSTPKMCSTKASTCRQMLTSYQSDGSHGRDLSSLFIPMTMSGFNRIGLDKQDCQQAAATRNGRKSEHHPWATSRHLAGIVSVPSGHCMLCTTSCPEFRNLGPGSLPLLSIDRGLQPFGACADHMYIRELFCQS